jgi:hypothetical protein
VLLSLATKAASPGRGVPNEYMVIGVLGYTAARASAA